MNGKRRKPDVDGKEKSIQYVSGSDKKEGCEIVNVEYDKICIRNLIKEDYAQETLG